MPTLTHVVRTYDEAGVRHRRVWLYTGPASYAAAGDPFVPNDVKLGEIEYFSGLATNGTAVRLLVYDPTNEVVHWFIPNTGAEVAGAVDLSTFTGRIEVAGKG